jgi:hypothetical protein
MMAQKQSSMNRSSPRTGSTFVAHSLRFNAGGQGISRQAAPAQSLDRFSWYFYFNGGLLLPQTTIGHWRNDLKTSGVPFRQMSRFMSVEKLPDAIESFIDYFNATMGKPTN